MAAALLAAVTPACADQGVRHLEGAEARQYLGAPKERFTSGGYTYEILRRSHRDSMNGRFSDAVLFSKSTNRYDYRQREDSHHLVVIGDPKGREEDPVTADAPVWNPIANAIGDDHPDPHVFLDAQGKELAVVYTGRRTQLRARPSPEGLLEVEIRVTTASKRKRDVLY